MIIIREESIDSFLVKNRVELILNDGSMHMGMCGFHALMPIMLFSVKDWNVGDEFILEFTDKGQKSGTEIEVQIKYIIEPYDDFSVKATRESTTVSSFVNIDTKK